MQQVIHQINYTKPGKLIGFLGPMFAGKTTKLLEIANQLPNYTVYKPIFDTRYSINEVVSHNGNRIKATPVYNTDDIKEYGNIIFDEIQFFQKPYVSGSFVEVISKLINAGSNIYFFGLDMDFAGNPFRISAELAAMSDEITKLKAKCQVCGCPASKTYKHSGSNHSIELGSSDKYEPRCNKHWMF